jgi:magnesium-protoporphyrin O-methyltransferase
MACCGSLVGAAAERQFSEKRAMDDLAQYRAKGPGATARLLLSGIAKARPHQWSLLDIGAGVGALTFELLEQGLGSAIGIDLSSGYVAAASEEARTRGRAGSTRFVHGDFLDLAGQLPVADIVTLDRVICCYPECDRLLSESLRHANRCFALSYPRDVWYVRTWVGLQNLGRWLCRNPFRTFVHSTSAMENEIRGTGFELFSRSSTRTWCADVYVRSAAAASS